MLARKTEICVVGQKHATRCACYNLVEIPRQATDRLRHLSSIGRARVIAPSVRTSSSLVPSLISRCLCMTIGTQKSAIQEGIVQVIPINMI